MGASAEQGLYETRAEKNVTIGEGCTRDGNGVRDMVYPRRPP